MTLTLWEPQVPELAEGAVSFTVYGKPQPAGSKRGFVHPHTKRVMIVDDAKGSRPWKQEIAGEAVKACGGRPLLSGPLSATFEFFFARPKGHFGSGRNAWTLRESAPPAPATRPDVDKLSRAVLDALSGVVYRDDAQIVRKRVSKDYGEPERVEITVQPF